MTALAGVGPRRGRWSATQCQRGHDITDPSNVHVMRSCNGPRRQCRACRLERQRARRRGSRLPAAVEFLPRTCEHCSGVYHHEPGGPSMRQWRERRYCSRGCAARARAERATGPCRLSEAELVRLRRMVGVV